MGRAPISRLAIAGPGEPTQPEATCATSSCARGSTGALQPSGSPESACSARHAPLSTLADGRGSTEGCSSPTGIRTGRPTPAGSSPGPGPWWSGPGATAVGIRGCGDGRPGPRPSGAVARYARRDHYASLRAALGAVADLLARRGWRAVVVCDDNALVDRAAAHRAGLGWYGQNSMLLLPGLGSWSVLGSVVTDAPLRAHRRRRTEQPGEGCGGCTRCLTACPTGALVAPGVLDARRCLAWLVQAPGVVPGRVPAGARRPHLRVRRVPAGLPHQPGRRPAAPSSRARGRVGTRGSTCSTSSSAPTRSCWPPTAGGTSPDAIPATCGATRWWPWATWGTAADPATASTLRRWRPVGRRDARRARPLGGRTAGPATTSWPRRT